MLDRFKRYWALVETELRIRTALARVGAPDILEWARSRCTRSLVALNDELNANVAPVDLQHFMAAVARDSGRYNDFVRTEAVRRLNEYFPAGFGASKRQTYALAAGWSMWASLFEPSHKNAARQVWDRLKEIMRAHPEWTPQSTDDRLLLAAFEGHSFEPSQQNKRFAEAVEFMEQTTRRGNRRWSELKAIENLAQVPAGYGYLYGLFAIDGEVCNGGFAQFYRNTGGAPAPLAAAAFREIGREDFAALVEESIKSARGESRPFEVLDTEYYALSRAEDSEWLNTAMERLVSTRPDLF